MLRTFLFATTAALTLAACNAGTDSTPGNETGMGNGAGTTMAEDTAAQGVGAAGAPMVNSTPDFVTAAAIGDMYEIEASKIALEKSKSADVKAFAQMMIKDHTATTAKLKATLASANVQATPPAALDDRRQGLIDNLKSASAADIDKVYLDQQTAAHQETLSVMKSYADDGDTPALKTLAAETAPKVQAHYDEVRKLDRGGADGTR